MQRIEDALLARLEERKAVGGLRQLKPETNAVDFCSNDYLGLACNESLTELIDENCKSLSVKNGSGGSRLLAGNTNLAVELEKYLASVFSSESSLFFTSGYTANLAILSCVPQKGDTILYDQLIHASLREGGRSSFAKQYSFKHNDLCDLEKKLKTSTGNKFVVAESIYSMDGDFGDLEGLLTICEKYDANLVWDEAHSTGIFGDKGSGLSCKLNLQDRIFARVYTFGKAMGVHGSCVAGSEILINYLINFARPFIYTTAPPMHSLIAVKSSFDYLNQHIYLQKELEKKIQFFKSYLQNNFSPVFNNLLPSDSAIQVIMVGGNKKTKKIALDLQKEGFDIRPVLSPTVSTGSERLRICLHVFNTEKQIFEMLSTLQNLLISEPY